MKRNHTLSEKLPLLSMLLSIAATTLVCALAASFSSSDFVQYLLISAAVFLRSGSIMVTVVMHFLIDWMYFVTNPALQNGEMANTGVTTAVIISCIVDLSMSAVGLWLIRPAVREKIEAVWQNKWNFADSDDGTDIGVRQYQPKH